MDCNSLILYYLQGIFAELCNCWENALWIWPLSAVINCVLLRAALLWR